jgi:hypothetical protein
MYGFKQELRTDRIKEVDKNKYPELQTIMAPIWIRKVSQKTLVGLTKSILPEIPAEENNGGDPQGVTVDQGNVEAILESFEALVLTGVVWGPRPRDIPDETHWGDPEEPCLEQDDLAGLKDMGQLVALGTAVLDFAGLGEEASQLAGHFQDPPRAEGSGNPPQAQYRLRDSTLGFSEGQPG